MWNAAIKAFASAWSIGRTVSFFIKYSVRGVANRTTTPSILQALPSNLTYVGNVLVEEGDTRVELIEYSGLPDRPRQ